LEGIIDSFEKQIEDEDIQIQTYFEADLPLIHCDERQLKHAFVHILKNANESMQDGGIVTVQVKKEEQNKIKVTISDQGCGIPPERIERLGEPFYRTDSKGTGRGLMVSYKVIENHKGEINIMSEEGKGTTVEISLPHSIGV
ncbi:MAG: ATP-binding protein, partial [Bacilli bacterium]